MHRRPAQPLLCTDYCIAAAAGVWPVYSLCKRCVRETPPPRLTLCCKWCHLLLSRRHSATGVWAGARTFVKHLWADLVWGVIGLLHLFSCSHTHAHRAAAEIACVNLQGSARLMRSKNTKCPNTQKGRSEATDFSWIALLKNHPWVYHDCTLRTCTTCSPQ